MTVRPILFSGPMVRALLDGRKTQTRRVLKFQPANLGAGNKLIIEVADYCTGAPERGKAYYWRHNGCWNSSKPFKLPYAPGDLLYVRESWFWLDLSETDYYDLAINYTAREERKHVHAPTGWAAPRGPQSKPSIHMPRWASRITLAVTEVKVERLQDISCADAIAEGIASAANSQTIDCDTPDPRHTFRALWDSINAKRAFGWKKNPWVVAVTFRTHVQNIDDYLKEAAVSAD